MTKKNQLYSDHQIQSAVDYCCMMLSGKLSSEFKKAVMEPLLNSRMVQAMDIENIKGGNEVIRFYPDDQAVERFRGALTNHLTEIAGDPSGYQSDRREGYGGSFLEQGEPYTLILYHAPSSNLLFDDVISQSLWDAGIESRDGQGRKPLPEFVMHLGKDGSIDVLPAISNSGQNAFGFRLNYRVGTETYFLRNPETSMEATMPKP